LARVARREKRGVQRTSMNEVDSRARWRS
jgi:hypothetical protein